MFTQREDRGFVFSLSCGFSPLEKRREGNERSQPAGCSPEQLLFPREQEFSLFPFTLSFLYSTKLNSLVRP